MLMSALVAISTLVVAQLWWQHHRLLKAAEQPGFASPQEHHLIPARTGSFAAVSAIAIAIIGVSALLYSQLGRYNDHHLQRPDHQLDYVLREELQQLALSASTPAQLEQLAQGYGKLGQYELAAATMAKLTTTRYATARHFSLQAKYSYYRDGRTLNTESQLLVSQSLALDPAEPEALLLLANDAYLHQDYAQAIDHWRKLIDSQPLGMDLAPIQRAITKAQQKLATLD